PVVENRAHPAALQAFPDLRRFISLRHARRAPARPGRVRRAGTLVMGELDDERAIGAPRVKINNVSRIYRTRRHQGSIWRQIFAPTYDDHLALDGVTLDLHAGRCLVFIRPNGAGKSTLVKLMTGLLQPSSGDLEAFGRRPSLRAPA